MNLLRSFFLIRLAIGLSMIPAFIAVPAVYAEDEEEFIEEEDVATEEAPAAKAAAASLPDVGFVRIKALATGKYLRPRQVGNFWVISGDGQEDDSSIFAFKKQGNMYMFEHASVPKMSVQALAIGKDVGPSVAETSGIVRFDSASEDLRFAWEFVPHKSKKAAGIRCFLKNRQNKGYMLVIPKGVKWTKNESNLAWIRTKKNKPAAAKVTVKKGLIKKKKVRKNAIYEFTIVEKAAPVATPAAAPVAEPSVSAPAGPEVAPVALGEMTVTISEDTSDVPIAEEGNEDEKEAAVGKAQVVTPEAAALQSKMVEMEEEAMSEASTESPDISAEESSMDAEEES